MDKIQAPLHNIFPTFDWVKKNNMSESMQHMASGVTCNPQLQHSHHMTMKEADLQMKHFKPQYSCLSGKGTSDECFLDLLFSASPSQIFAHNLTFTTSPTFLFPELSCRQSEIPLENVFSPFKRTSNKKGLTTLYLRG